MGALIVRGGNCYFGTMPRHKSHIQTSPTSITKRYFSPRQITIKRKYYTAPHEALLCWESKGKSICFVTCTRGIMWKWDTQMVLFFSDKKRDTMQTIINGEYGVTWRGNCWAIYKAKQIYYNCEKVQLSLRGVHLQAYIRVTYDVCVGRGHTKTFLGSHKTELPIKIGGGVVKLQLSSQQL